MRSARRTDSALKTGCRYERSGCSRLSPPRGVKVVRDQLSARCADSWSQEVATSDRVPHASHYPASDSLSDGLSSRDRMSLPAIRLLKPHTAPRSPSGPRPAVCTQHELKPRDRMTLREIGLLKPHAASRNRSGPRSAVCTPHGLNPGDGMSSERSGCSNLLRPRGLIAVHGPLFARHSASTLAARTQTRRQDVVAVRSERFSTRFLIG